MNRFPVFIAFVHIFSSCIDHSKNELAVYKAADEGFYVSNQNISASTLEIYRSMENRLSDPLTREHTIIWQPKAAVVHQLSTDLIKYISGLRNQLTNGKERGSEEYRKIIGDNNNEGVVQVLFGDEGKGEELYLKLKKYEKEMLAIDSEINSVFAYTSIAISREFEKGENRSEEFTKTYFHNMPVIGALSMLSKFENNVTNMENQFIRFCHNKTYVIVCGFGSRPHPVVTQSSSYVKAGDEIEINAGIHDFTTAALPRVTIKNTAVPVNPDGVAIYRFKTSITPGKYSVPVKIEYTKPDGAKELVIKKIEYTVAE